MSKLIGIGALFSGIGGAAAGAAAVWQLVAPGPIETPQDLIQVLTKIETAIQGRTYVPNTLELQGLETALDGLNTQIVQSAHGENGELLSVARSFAGMREYKDGEIFDFVAPNGERKLFVVNVKKEYFYFSVDGQNSRSPALGQHITIEFGDQSCVFENIGIEPNKSAQVRISCA